MCVCKLPWGWWDGGWLRCRYVLGSSLEPGPHHYSPAADDTDPLSNLSPGADRGRLLLHHMLDWYSPHPAPHVLNLHCPPSSLILSLFLLLRPDTSLHLFWCTEAKLCGDEELSLKQNSPPNLSLSHSGKKRKEKKITNERLRPCGGI